MRVHDKEGGTEGSERFDGKEKMNFDEIKKLMESKSEMVEKIKESSVQLQDCDLENDGEHFNSHYMKPIEGICENKVYCSIHTTEFKLAEEFKLADKLTEALGRLTGDDDDEENPFASILEAMIDVKGQMGFTITASTGNTSIRIFKGNDVDEATVFPNVNSADDIIKLASFYGQEYVEPLLKDYETIKDIMGA